MACVIEGNHVLLLTVGLQLLGILVPYGIVFHRDVFSPPLPFISQTIAFNPENGIFSLFLIVGSFFGILTSFLINTSLKPQGSGILNLAKSASTFFSILYFLSWILIVASPITYTDVRSKYEWITLVLLPHMIGALLMLSSCTFFIISQGVLSWNLNKFSENYNIRRKCVFIILPTACIGIASLIALGVEEMDSNGYSMAEVYYVLPTQLSNKYVATSICEWTIIYSMWMILLTFHNDLCKLKIRIEVKNKLLN